MLNAKLVPVLVMVGATAAVWGCGDDPKTSGTGGRGGNAGASGKGGASGSSGKGGSAGTTGGSAGSSAGKGGSAGTAGTSGGTAGTGGSAGSSAGKGGSAGTMDVAGQGGEGGDAPGGAGGEGGASGLNIAQACAAVCQDQTGLACSSNLCTANCIGLAGDTPAPSEFAALIQCEATELGANDYECFMQTGFPDMAGASWGEACETELCAWTCADQTFVEEQTFGHCGC